MMMSSNQDGEMRAVFLEVMVVTKKPYSVRQSACESTSSLSTPTFWLSGSSGGISDFKCLEEDVSLICRHRRSIQMNGGLVGLGSRRKSMEAEGLALVTCLSDEWVTCKTLAADCRAGQIPGVPSTLRKE